MTTLAVTGAGGFIGLRMIERARERGFTVRGLDCSPDAAGRARQAGAEVTLGDVNDAEAAATFCRGADVVFHTAALVVEGGDFEPSFRVNVLGTRAMLAAARASGVRHFVHLSSVMVYGFDYPPEVAEDGPLRGHGNPYCETKIESDRDVLAANGPELGTIVLRPGDVYGPGSTPWVVRPILQMRSGLFALPSGGRGMLNPIYVDDLCDAAFLALTRERDAVGEAFNITDGRAVTCLHYFERLAKMVGRRRVRTLPARLMRGLLAATGAAYRLSGKRSPVEPAAVDFLLRPHAVSSAKARRVLGFVPRFSLEQGLRRVEAWVRHAQDDGTT